MADIQDIIRLISDNVTDDELKSWKEEAEEEADALKKQLQKEDIHEL